MSESTRGPLTPQVDLTAVNAVQSIFDRGREDPWSRSMAADFVDFALWSDRIRYPVLLLESDRERSTGIVAPALLDDLNRREAGLVTPDIRILAKRPLLEEDLLEPAWRTFAAFLASNPRQVREFLSVHTRPWIREQIQSRFSGESQYIFDVRVLSARPGMESFAQRLRLTEVEIYYLFDLVLKYLLYAEQAGGGYYLSHPIRAKLDYRRFDVALSVKEPQPHTVPFRLGPYLVNAAVSRDQDWFTSRLHEARAFVRESNMTDLAIPGVVSREELRRLAVRLGLPASIKNFTAIDRAATIASAAAGAAGTIVTTSPLPAVIGSALSVVTSLWSGEVPEASTKVAWLQWMLEWSIEGEADQSAD